MPSALKRFRWNTYLAGVAVGNRSEEKAEEVLWFLTQKGEIFTYEWCWKNGENDINGRDFLVFPEPDWIIPFQVKSSEKGREDHIRKYGTRIPCVVVKDYMAVDILAEEFLEALGLSTRFLEEEIVKAQSEPFNTLVEELLKILGLSEEEVNQENKLIDELVQV